MEWWSVSLSFKGTVQLQCLLFSAELPSCWQLSSNLSLCALQAFSNGWVLNEIFLRAYFFLLLCSAFLPDICGSGTDGTDTLLARVQVQNLQQFRWEEFEVRSQLPNHELIA